MWKSAEEAKRFNLRNLTWMGLPKRADCWDGWRWKPLEEEYERVQAEVDKDAALKTVSYVPTCCLL